MEEDTASRYFTHFWTRDTWDQHAAEEPPGLLIHTAGNQFIKRGVRPGDFLYVVTVRHGVLLVAGRMRVHAVLDLNGAAELLHSIRETLWDASEHPVALASETTLRVFDVEVPEEVTRQLLFEGPDGPKPPVMREGKLDAQTLRGVRRLTVASARLLDRFVKLP